MATVKVSGEEDGEKKLTTAEAKMLLDAKIRQKFRWAVRSLVGDDGNQLQSFDGGAFERIVADIRDDIIAEMRYSDDTRQAIRNGIKNFNIAYVKGVLKKAIKGKEIPNPGIIVSAAAAVAEMGEGKMPAWLKKKVKKKGKKKGKKNLPPEFLKNMGKK